MRKLLPLLALLLSATSLAQEPVSIRVDASRSLGALKPVYRFFGYDEPNYTYTKNGRKLIGELASLSASPAYIRTHFLLATGDGKPAFKWGSTNAYTEDGSGKPIYEWTIVDRILRTYLDAGAKPFVEIGFMPEALSSKPQPYRPIWSPGAPFDKYYSGWSYPPNDYKKWSSLIYEWVRHSVAEYGAGEVATWYWEVWNEPDISYWHGSPEDYDKLYDATAASVKRALPSAQVGGPASTGPSSARAAAFLQQFLDHCVKAGSPLDFVSFHAKGRASVVDGHVRMGLAKNLQDVDKGLEIVASFPKLRRPPIILSESDPEGCAACSARVYPQNAYRNGPLYPAYTAAALANILKLAEARNANLEGMLTWAFEFENQPYFDGFRTLATNGIDKAILNLFRMEGLMGGSRIAVESSQSMEARDIMKSGVAGRPYVDGLAAATGHKVSVLVWNYHDDDLPRPDTPVRLVITGLPSIDRVLLRHYRVDQEHSNPYPVWKAMGSPQNPTREQYRLLESAGQLQLLDSPRWITAHGKTVEAGFTLPLPAVSLVELTW